MSKLCISINTMQKHINPKKCTSMYKRSKIIMNTSKCPDSKNIEDVYVETMKKLSQPAIVPIVEQLTMIEKKIEETDTLLQDIDSRLNDIIHTLHKIDKNNKYPYDDEYVEGIRETNDVY